MLQIEWQPSIQMWILDLLADEDIAINIGCQSNMISDTASHVDYVHNLIRLPL